MKKRTAYKIINRHEACRVAGKPSPYTPHQWLRAMRVFTRDLRYGPDRKLVPELSDCINQLQCLVPPKFTPFGPYLDVLKAVTIPQIAQQFGFPRNLIESSERTNYSSQIEQR